MAALQIVISWKPGVIDAHNVANPTCGKLVAAVLEA
jgi:hypothetical protein